MTDIAGYRSTVGVLIPSTNTMVESDLWRLRIPGVTFHAARMYVESPALDSDDAFESVLGQIDGALASAIRDVLTCRPDQLIMGMSAPTFWGGRNGHQAFVERVRDASGLTVVTGARSTEEALGAVGARRVALLTPYQPIMSREIVRYFADVDIEVVRHRDLQCPSATAIARVEPGAVRAAIARIDGDDVDAIVQIGTNLSVATLVPELEAALGKPVIANNAACAWHAYRSAGFTDRIENAGMLFDTH